MRVYETKSENNIFTRVPPSPIFVLNLKLIRSQIKKALKIYLLTVLPANLTK